MLFDRTNPDLHTLFRIPIDHPINRLNSGLGVAHDGAQAVAPVQGVDGVVHLRLCC